MNSLNLQALRRSRNVWRLTHRYFLPRQVSSGGCRFYINGHTQVVEGQNALSLLINIVLDDCYGLKRFKTLPSIVDIGANIGVFSLHAATLFPGTPLLAFEPFRNNLDYLKTNLNFPNCVIYQEAVGATHQRVQIQPEDDLSACHVVFNDSSPNSDSPHDQNNSDAQYCQMVTLAEVTERLNNSIGLLKLDCEGSEYEIFESEALERANYIVGELHTCELGDPTSGLETLKNRGFTIDRWVLFPDGKAGEFWASNNRNSQREKDWLR